MANRVPQLSVILASLDDEHLHGGGVLLQQVPELVEGDDLLQGVAVDLNAVGVGADHGVGDAAVHAAADVDDLLLVDEADGQGLQLDFHTVIMAAMEYL